MALLRATAKTLAELTTNAQIATDAVARHDWSKTSPKIREAAWKKCIDLECETGDIEAHLGKRVLNGAHRHELEEWKNLTGAASTNSELVPQVVAGAVKLIADQKDYISIAKTTLAFPEARLKDGHSTAIKDALLSRAESEGATTLAMVETMIEELNGSAALENGEPLAVDATTAHLKTSADVRRTDMDAIADMAAEVSDYESSGSGNNPPLTKEEIEELHDDSGRGELRRLLRYFRHLMLIVSHQNRTKLYLCNHHGLWMELDHKNNESSIGYLTVLIHSARMMAVEEQLPMNPEMWREGVKPRDTRTLAAYVTQMTTTGMTNLMGYDVNVATSVMLNDRNSHPILPLANGGALDFETGKEISVAELATKRFTYFGWQIPMPRTLKSSTPTLGETVAEKYWGPHGRLHPILLRAAAWVAGGVDKTIDCVKGAPNSGKTAAAQALKRAFPNAIEVLQAPTIMHSASTRFTPLQNHLAGNLAVMVDEIDKLVVNEKTGCAIHEGKLNELAAEDMSVEPKGLDVRVMLRQGTAVLIGNEWPSVNVRAAGARERLQWAYAIPEKFGPMPKKDRNLLLSPDATRQLREMVLEHAREQGAKGNDLWEVPEARAADVHKLTQSNISLEEQELCKLLVTDKKGRVPAYALPDILERAYGGNPPKTSAIPKVLRKVFGNHVQRVERGRDPNTGSRTWEWRGISETRPF